MIIARPADRHSGVAINDWREQPVLHPAKTVTLRNIDAQRERAHIGDSDFIERGVAGEQPCLNRRAECYGMIRMDAAIGKTAEHPGDCAADNRHPGCPADQHDLAQRFGIDGAVTQRADHRIAQPLQQGIAAQFKLGGGDGCGQPLLAIDHDEFSQIAQAQRPARGFCGACQQRGAAISGQFCQRGFGINFRLHHCRQRQVEIVTAEPVIARRGAYLDDTFKHFDHRDIKGSAAQIKHQKRLAIAAILHAESKRGGCRLVDQAPHREARKLASTPRRLALAVVEIGRHGDHRFGGDFAGGCGHIIAQ